MSEPEIVKMLLPGESPWGEIIARFPDGTAHVMIDNKLLNEWPENERAKLWPDMPPITAPHRYKENDVVLCRLNAEFGKWEPVADTCAGRA